MRWRECSLLNILEIVVRGVVVLHFANFYQWEIFVAPRLGDVKWILLIVQCLLLGHNLEVHLPFRKITSFDGVIQIALMAFSIFSNDFSSFFVSQILNTLLSHQMELHPKANSVFIDKAIGVRTKAMHVAIRSRNASIGHHHRNLMKSFGKHCPKVPIVLSRAHVGSRVSLYSMIQIGELERVANKEYRGIVSYQIPVAFIGIKLNGKATNVTFRS